MRLALIGATGWVGRRVLDEALRRGHEVTALTRDVTRIAERPGLRAVQADVREPDTVAAAVAGHDAVLSCFHPGGHDVGENPTLYRDIVEGTRTMLDGIRRSDVRRIVYVGGCGSLYVRPGVMLIDDPETLLAHVHHGRPEGTYPLPSGPVSLDIPLGARMAYYLFELEAELDWTFLSPSRFLGDFGGRGDRIVVGGDELLLEDDGTPAKLDVEDLAVAMLDEVESGAHVRGHFTVASAPRA